MTKRTKTTRSFTFTVDEAVVIVAALDNYIDPVLNSAEEVDRLIKVTHELNDWVRTVDPARALKPI